MFFHKIISTGFGIGYLRKGGGTIAAALIALAWYFLFPEEQSFVVPIGVLLAFIVLGIWSASEVEKLWGKDSSHVVIDEMAGMSLSLLFVPVSALTVFIGFVLFRFFDIVKPLFIKRLERLPKGWGVMMDDLLAGFYANLLLHGLVNLKVL